MKHTRSTNTILILLFMAGMAFHARPESPGEDTALPGHRQSESSLLAVSTDIAVVALTARGKIELGPPGVLNYFDAKVQVEKSLKGTAAGEVKCVYDLQEAPASDSEKEPTEGKRYIVFMKGRDPRVVMRILRFIEASDQRVGELQKMLDAVSKNS